MIRTALIALTLLATPAMAEDVVFTMTQSGLKPTTQRTTMRNATLQDCETAAGIAKLISYFDGTRIKTKCEAVRHD